MLSHRPPRLLLTAILASSALAAAACTNEASTQPGDSPADAGAPSALGNGLRIAQMNAPDSAVRPVANQLNVPVTGATFLIKDEYSETGLPSAVGSIYVQDFHSSEVDAGGAPPYSGILLYKTTFEPASLALAPGDVIDFIGEYQLYNGPPTFSFAGAVQPEMYEAIASFRFDYSPPAPTVIQASDLQSYATGYKWMSMLVTVENVTGGGQLGDGTGRCGVFLTQETGQSAVKIDNELYNFNEQCTNPASIYAKYGAVHFKSVTGIVTYFSSFTLSPRSDADIVLD